MVGEVHDGVDGDESAEAWVVVAGADAGQAGGVFGLVEEAAVAGPGGLGAASVAEGGAVSGGWWWR